MGLLSGVVDLFDPEGRSLQGFLGNVGSNIGDIGGGLIAMAEQAVTEPSQIPGMVGALPGAIVDDISARYGMLLPGGDPAGEFGAAFYEQPASYGLDALGAYGAAKALPRAIPESMGGRFKGLIPENPKAQALREIEGTQPVYNRVWEENYGPGRQGPGGPPSFPEDLDNFTSWLAERYRTLGYDPYAGNPGQARVGNTLNRLRNDESGHIINPFAQTGQSLHPVGVNNVQTMVQTLTNSGAPQFVIDEVFPLLHEGMGTKEFGDIVNYVVRKRMSGAPKPPPQEMAALPGMSPRPGGQMIPGTEGLGPRIPQAQPTGALEAAQQQYGMAGHPGPTPPTPDELAAAQAQEQFQRQFAEFQAQQMGQQPVQGALDPQVDAMMRQGLRTQPAAPGAPVPGFTTQQPPMARPPSPGGGGLVHPRVTPDPEFQMLLDEYEQARMAYEGGGGPPPGRDPVAAAQELQQTDYPTEIPIEEVRALLAQQGTGAPKTRPDALRQASPTIPNTPMEARMVPPSVRGGATGKTPVEGVRDRMLAALRAQADPLGSRQPVLGPEDLKMESRAIEGFPTGKQGPEATSPVGANINYPGYRPHDTRNIRGYERGDVGRAAKGMETGHQFVESQQWADQFIEQLMRENPTGWENQVMRAQLELQDIVGQAGNLAERNAAARESYALNEAYMARTAKTGQGTGALSVQGQEMGRSVPTSGVRAPTTQQVYGEPNQIHPGSAEALDAFNALAPSERTRLLGQVSERRAAAGRTPAGDTIDMRQVARQIAKDPVMLQRFKESGDIAKTWDEWYQGMFESGYGATAPNAMSGRPGRTPGPRTAEDQPIPQFTSSTSGQPGVQQTSGTINPARASAEGPRPPAPAPEPAPVPEAVAPPLDPAVEAQAAAITEAVLERLRAAGVAPEVAEDAVRATNFVTEPPPLTPLAPDEIAASRAVDEAATRVPDDADVYFRASKTELENAVKAGDQGAVAELERRLAKKQTPASPSNFAETPNPPLSAAGQAQEVNYTRMSNADLKKLGEDPAATAELTRRSMRRGNKGGKKTEAQSPTPADSAPAANPNAAAAPIELAKATYEALGGRGKVSRKQLNAELTQNGYKPLSSKEWDELRGMRQT